MCALRWKVFVGWTLVSEEAKLTSDLWTDLRGVCSGPQLAAIGYVCVVCLQSWATRWRYKDRRNVCLESKCSELLRAE